MSSLPTLSTVTQKLELTQETERSALPASIAVGPDHAVPFQVNSFPPLSTATQKLELTQETEPRNTPLSTEAGGDQDPFKVSAFPTESTATQKPELFTQEMEVRALPASIGPGADQK